jgi:predicted transcriptional regulator
MQLSCNSDSSQKKGRGRFRVEEKDNGRLSLAPGTHLREVLEMLWNSGKCSVRDVVAGLDGKLGSGAAYSTVASALNKLCDAGLATRSRMQGAREYLYSALISREQVEKAATVEAVHTVLKGARSPGEALSYLVEIIGHVDRRLLDDLKDSVERQRGAARPKR